ncbi:ribosome small subunit-dependent GTPase A [Lipingzhangella sp. LS1_29]|uniref:Small ribosomal subunit biogenesis GTPase RsgA n=1 Tax=Lipingzhangella rawalii TaxID=2055835 RepID=A0ABU2HB86_9ACTN|nr:ribosome small subunit-dependent GTPase A [Lipingzhangella rawalii]MDS1272541.1 ribosome small subunit-dependent GTPase A [Lipingzhangella rawalii]
MRRRSRDLDEDDVRVRARGGSRPRTRNRPEHADARIGMVTAVNRGRYQCLVGDRAVTAMKARELGRGSIVVGDRVALVGDLSGEPDTLARVVRVEKRSSALRRTADDTDPSERVIVANADQMVIVAALADPAPQPRLIDRCLVAAYDAGLLPLLCLTKADLTSPADMTRHYAPLGLDIVVTRCDEASGREELYERLRGRCSVLVGSSGVGKSTLVNGLVPEADRAVGTVNPVTGRGRHVSSSAIALPLREGWLIDTPGVRSFGLAHVAPETITAAFPDLEVAIEECPPGCAHSADTECALDTWRATGRVDAARVDSLRRLLASRAGEE